MIFLENSSLNISNSTFKNITIYGNHPFLSASNNNFLNQYFIIFENVSVFEVTTSLNNTNPLIFLQNANSLISFQNCYFANNFANAIIMIFNISSSVLFNNVTFIQNSIFFQAIDIEEINYLIMNLVNCIANNPNNMLNNGGCFRTKNVLSRSFQNLSIINCSSSQTTPGVKIIDDDDINGLMVFFLIHL